MGPEFDLPSPPLSTSDQRWPHLDGSLMPHVPKCPSLALERLRLAFPLLVSAVPVYEAKTTLNKSYFGCRPSCWVPLWDPESHSRAASAQVLVHSGCSFLYCQRLLGD